MLPPTQLHYCFHNQSYLCPTLHIHGKDISASGKEVEVTKHLRWAMGLYSSAICSAFGLEGTRSVISGAGG